MYSEEDINSAVTAGALSADAAASFRAHMTQIRDMPRGDEENFRLIIFIQAGEIDPQFRGDFKAGPAQILRHLQA